MSWNVPKPGQPRSHKMLRQQPEAERRQLNVFIRSEWVDYVRAMAVAQRTKPYAIIEDALELYRKEAGDP